MIDELIKILESGTKEELEKFAAKHGLEIRNGKLVAKNPEEYDKHFKFWDKRQLVRKILLNSLYGAILNPHCRFFDQRLGQSTTLTGKSIAKHMAASCNEMITGEYDHRGQSIIYGDSVTGDSMIRSSVGEIKIEDLFDQFRHTIVVGDDKEYALPTETDEDDRIKVLGYSAYDDVASYKPISYVMRHKTQKQLYEIETEDGKTVTVTEDHSLIVDRDGFTIEVKPADLRDDDVLITYKLKNPECVNAKDANDDEYIQN